MSSDKDKGLAIILVSALVFFSNSGGFLMANVVLGDMGEVDFMPPIFNIVCGVMITLSIAGMLYGFRLRKES
ncbi:hypothetical protein [Frigoriflavimonas asaccharolytica]|uniref:Uncharacterized protein n=1 Tax=Frigoriflavimonas asaccharolytica TaxID=2735899 RepID=A0A8J8KAB7_9FLAO|nr:hypothetical protein [Frigoriflavimonas asaccharolytica]NRS93992.1 hypothetical protein [Frigoriflavimonas asaccharolytica]